MKIKQLAISLVLGLLLTTFPLSVVAHASTWFGSGPGTVTVVGETCPQLQYKLDPAGYARQTWDFHTTAEADGEIELH